MHLRTLCRQFYIKRENRQGKIAEKESKGKKMGKTVTMADIAARLGVSTVTVSKALGGRKGVGGELRQRILRLAEEMGYPIPGGKEQEKESYNIGVLMSEMYIEKYDTFYWELYQKITGAAVKTDCFVLLEILEKEAESKLGEIKLLREKKIDGLMVLGSISTQFLEHLQESSAVPMVFMDFYDDRVKEDCIISNSFYGACQLTDYLFDHGHEEIAFVGTVLATKSITDRFLGYQKALLEHGKEVRKDWVIPDRDDSRSCYERITLPETLPSAYVCNNDLTASKVIKSLRERGISVPEEASVTGFDDYLYPGLCDVELTTYAVNMEKMSEAGVKLLVEKIKGATKAAGIHMIEGSLVERGSVSAKRN